MSRPADLDNLPAFFTRNNLSRTDLTTCLRHAADRNPDSILRPARTQGGCSYTLFATPCNDAELPPCGRAVQAVIQFRLSKHAVPPLIANQACDLYSPLAPTMREISALMLDDGCESLQVCTMSYIPGERLSELQPRVPCLLPLDLKRYERLLADMAEFFARSWRAETRSRTAPTLGRIGSSIMPRLALLEKGLPSRALRDRARAVRVKVQAAGLESVPTVLTHGDWIPWNIIVDPGTWGVQGYVDWAEAEWLPAGVSLYGLEHLLCYVDVKVDGSSPRVVYYEQAERLREYFWTEVEERISDWGCPSVREGVWLAREVGVLLWRGFAWDDGRVDRVVNARDDAEELALLHAFLDVPDTTAGRRDSRMVV